MKRAKEWSNGPLLKDRSIWTYYQDFGIFLADAVIEGDWSVLDGILGLNGYLLTIKSSCDDIQCDIIRPGFWHWRHTDAVAEGDWSVLDDILGLNIHVPTHYLFFASGWR